MKKTLLATLLVLTLLLTSVLPCFAATDTETQSTATRISDYFLTDKDYYTLHAAKTATGFTYGGTELDDQWSGVLSFAWLTQSRTKIKDDTSTEEDEKVTTADVSLGTSNNGNSEYRILWDADYLYILLDKLNATATISVRYHLVVDEELDTTNGNQSCYVDVDYASNTATTNYTKNTVNGEAVTEGTEIDSASTDYPAGLQTVVRTGTHRNGSVNYTWETRIPWTAIHGDAEFDMTAATKVGLAIAWSNSASTLDNPNKYMMSGMANGTSCWVPLILGCNDVIVPDTSWYTEPLEQDENTTDFYINDAADLLGLSLLINNQTSASALQNITKGKTFYLTDDIDLNPGWIYDPTTKNTNLPSNFWHSIIDFRGVLDGQGHTVRGLYNNGSAVKWLLSGTSYRTYSGSGTSSSNYVVKFPIGFTTDLKGDLKNVAFVDGWFNTGYATSIGAIAGTLHSGCSEVSNLYVDIDVSAEPATNSAKAADSRMGGLFGGTYTSTQSTTMKNVVYAGDITTNYVQAPTSGSTPTGGLIGRHSTSPVKLSMSDCLFMGTITEKANTAGNSANEFFGKVSSSGIVAVDGVTMPRCFAVVTTGSAETTPPARYTRDEATGLVTDGNETNSDNIIEIEKSDLAADKIDFLMENYLGTDNLNNTWTYEKSVGALVPMGVAEVLNSGVYMQRTAFNEGKTNVRVLAILDGLNWSEVGFKITMTYDGVTKNIDATETDAGDGIETTDTVWTSVYANGEPVTADSLGGNYLYGVVINNVPETGVTFNVQLYKVAMDGTTVVEGVNTITVDVADIPTPAVS